MSVPLLKIAIFRKSVIKGKMDVRFPANIETHNFLTVARANGTYTFDVDYSVLTEITSFDPTQKLIAIEGRDGVWNVVSLASLISGSQTTQIVTAAGAVTVQPNDGLIILNKAVGAATTVNLPAAASKVGKVKIVDWKGDAGTNNITIVPNGTEKIQGLSQWVLAGDNSSIVLDPVTGGVTGYAI